MNFLHKPFARCGIFLTCLSFTGVALAVDYPVGGNKAHANEINRATPALYESFEGAGWNSRSSVGGKHKPGLKKSLPKSFLFAQLQGPHSFSADRKLARIGNYSAELLWKHTNPGRWNGAPNKIDNTDKKAMFHGPAAKNVKTTVWYGFSFYLPSHKTPITGQQDPLIFQVHGAADKNEPNRNPPVALTVSKDHFHVGWGWDSARKSVSVKGEGRGKIDINMKLSNYQDRWVDVVMQTRTDPFEKNGFIKMWVDGKEVLNKRNIKLGYNDKTGMYPSFGWYMTESNDQRKTDATLYMDELRMVEGSKADYFDVAPGVFTSRSQKASTKTTSIKTTTVTTRYETKSDNLQKPTGLNANYELAALPGETINVTGTMNIAYGANGKYFYAYNQTKNLECSNRVFGDPIQGVKKACYVRTAPGTSKPAASTKPAPSAKNCLRYAGNKRVELDLGKYKCVVLPNNLRGKTVQVWDSDKAVCNFRGVVKSNDGKGKVTVDSNYVSSKGLTGKRIDFTSNNKCQKVKIRIF